MLFDAYKLFTCEMLRDKFYLKVPAVFRSQIKATTEYKRKAAWASVSDSKKFNSLKKDFIQWVECLVGSLEVYKPLSKNIAFDEDALKKKCWLLSNDVNLIQSYYYSHLNVNENSTEEDKRGALGAMAEIYKRFHRLTLTGLTEDFGYKHYGRFLKALPVEGLVKVDALDCGKFEESQEYQSEILSTLLKALEPEWWFRRYKKAYARMVEEFAVSVGLVGKKSRYCTDFTLGRIRLNDSRNQRFLEGIEVERSDGFRVSLGEVIKHSLANPSNRHAQLMAHIAGLEKLGKHDNLTATFYTITAPSKYHKNSSKYGGYTPSQGREYLQEMWQKLRASLNRSGVVYYGVRVAEAHKDACPHWHLMLWCKSSEQDFVDSVFKKYALAEDYHELLVNGVLKCEPDLSARKNGVVFRTPRLEIKRMLAHLGHPTGYILKYISKNIKSHDDSKAPAEVTTYADRVNAWARTHRIRQFQFIGDEKVGAWNEARRMSPEIIKKFNVTLTGKAREFIEVCRGNDWFNYVLLMREHNVNVNKEVYRDGEFFSRKTKIVGLSVEHKNPVRAVFERIAEYGRLGYKVVSKMAVEASERMISFDVAERYVTIEFSTRFYEWKKRVLQPDRVEEELSAERSFPPWSSYTNCTG